MSRRTVFELAGAAVAAGAIGGAYWLGNRETEREWEDLDGKPLQLLAARDDTANGQRRLLVDQWNAWHGDHPVEMVELSPIADLQYSAIHAALQSEDPDVDVVDLDIPWVAEFASAGRLEPLDGIDTGGFLERPLEAGRFEGELYALPFNTNVGMLYYRKHIDPESDPDYRNGVLTELEASSIRTWDDLRRTIGWILREDNGFTGGIAMQLASYEGFTVNVWEYLLANGIDVADDTGMIGFGPRSDAVGLLEDLWSDLWEPVRQNKWTVLPAAVQHNEDESLAAFQAGLTPFLRHWPQAIRTLESCEAFAAAGSDVPFEVGVVPMPGGVLGGGSLAVSAYSKRKNVSRALIEFLTGPTSQQLLFDRGGFAATRPEPYFDAMAQVASGVADGDCESIGGPRREAGAMYEALTGEGPGQRPEVDRYAQFSYAFRDELYGRLANDDAPDFSGLERRLERAVEGK
ncbi:extracellular solute-binding protein [Glycomyces luteolus]|uniref:Extracellular solute-binding protein n=1 Tax=Glycomyces luteolus TaxID=2670330 RepID=A0A9X3SPK6_9ACTN|nr:extracellular solute-binding protein [Glycomyces luteolus]MDA1359051.1 extracellular solute-binding protein [Glycomyces luteolus]